MNTTRHATHSRFSEDFPETIMERPEYSLPQVLLGGILALAALSSFWGLTSVLLSFFVY